MSVSWVKFKLRQNSDLPTLRAMADEQSRHFKIAYNWPVPGQTFEVQDRERAGKRFLETSQRLIKLLDFSPARIGDEIQSKKVAPIAYNSLLPYEWREAAKRTYLPGEFQVHLRRWKQFVNETRQGLYEDYHFRLFMYEDYNPFDHGYKSWHQLRRDLYQQLDGPAEDAETEEEWREDDGFKRMKEELLKKPVQPLKVEIPKFSEAERDRKLDLETEAEFAYFKDEIERLMAQIIAWNRCVPESHKMRIPSFLPAQVRLEQRRTNETYWLTDYFHWCDEVVNENLGLFLYF